MNAACVTTGMDGVILAGGRSSRMGSPKALLPFGRARLIDHVAARLSPQVSSLFLNANDAAVTLPEVDSFGDRYAEFPGPLAGIHAALDHVTRHGGRSATHVAMVPVDSPFFPTDLVQRLAAVLSSADDLALTMSNGRFHPVMGLWPLSALPALTRWLDNPRTLKVRAFAELLQLHTVVFPLLETPLGEVDPFFNINTPEDLQRARDILRCLSQQEQPDA